MCYSLSHHSLLRKGENESPVKYLLDQEPVLQKKPQSQKSGLLPLTFPGN